MPVEAAELSRKPGGIELFEGDRRKAGSFHVDPSQGFSPGIRGSASALPVAERSTGSLSARGIWRAPRCSLRARSLRPEGHPGNSGANGRYRSPGTNGCRRGLRSRRCARRRACPRARRWRRRRRPGPGGVPPRDRRSTHRAARWSISTGEVLPWQASISSAAADPTRSFRSTTRSETSASGRPRTDRAPAGSSRIPRIRW